MHDLRSDFSPSRDAMTKFMALLGPAGVVTDHARWERYETSPNRWSGRAASVLRPRDVTEVRQIMAICREHKLKLVPQGANSGLVGSSVPDASGEQIVLSTERLLQHFKIDVEGRSITASSGWALAEISERVRVLGLRFPVEVGSSPSVGGMVSTNTAGANVIRYGDVRKRLLGVQGVLPNTDLAVLDTLSALRKRNEGFDIAQLFVGTQGSLGIVTAASFELDTVPVSRAAAWIDVPDSRQLGALLLLFERQCGEWLTAFELASRTAIELLERNHQFLLNRLPSRSNDCVLVEIGAPTEGADEALQTALETADTQGLIGEAIVASPDKLWEVRHTIPTITEKLDPVCSFDISVPRSAVGELRRSLGVRIKEFDPNLIIIELGHVGDGGLHLILAPNLPVEAQCHSDFGAVQQLVFETVVNDFSGSFAAEHGVGPKNIAAYQQYVPEDIKSVHRSLKALCDPDGILVGI